MTYDELMELIDERIEDCQPDCNKHKWINAPWLALRAVVELHKPIDVDEKYDKGLFCGCCEASVPMHRVPLQEYPCPTIQAIEKML